MNLLPYLFLGILILGGLSLLINYIILSKRTTIHHEAFKELFRAYQEEKRMRLNVEKNFLSACEKVKEETDKRRLYEQHLEHLLGKNFKEDIKRIF
jgi:hypothetical protein